MEMHTLDMHGAKGIFQGSIQVQINWQHSWRTLTIELKVSVAKLQINNHTMKKLLTDLFYVKLYTKRYGITLLPW